MRGYEAPGGLIGVIKDIRVANGGENVLIADIRIDEGIENAMSR